MIKISHRGYCVDAKENTLKAIQDAIKSFDMIEIDIQLDKDNNIIVFHNTFVEKLYIYSLHYKEIKTQYPELLLLKDLFKNIEYKNIKLYFDLKGENKLADELHSFIIKNNIDITNIWFGSFNINHLEILSKKELDYKLGLITNNDFTIDILSYISSKYNLKFICFDWLILNKNIIQFLKSKQINVFCYTLNDENKNFIFDYKVDGVVTDILF
jgi:glycerophosphoryl diester phosphodiesterase